MTTKIVFNEQACGDAMARMIEVIASNEDLGEWFEQSGIDQEFLYDTAQALATEGMTDPAAALIMGVCVAWEVARRQL